MRKLFYCVVVLMMVLAIASCSDHKGASELYDRVNAAILSNPDSALAQLQSMSSDINSSDEAMSCTYSLLCIKAKDKAYIPHESDSLILAILPYFEKNTDHLPEAYYYAGRVYSDMGDAPKALFFYQKSLELLPEDSKSVDVLKLKTVLLSQIGYIVRYQNLNIDCRTYCERAYVCDSLLKDTTNMVISLIDWGNSYRDSGDCDSAMFFYKKAERLCNLTHKEVDISNVLSQESKLYYDRKEYEKALSCFLKIHNCNNESKSGINAIGALIYYALDMKDSAYYYWSKNIENGTIYAKAEAYGGLANIEMSRGNINNVTKYINKYIELSDSVRERIQSEAVIKINKFYNYKHKEEELNALKIANMEKKHGIFMLGSIIVIIVLVCIFICHHMHIKQLNTDLQLARYQRMVENLESAKQNKDMEQKEEKERIINASDIVYRINTMIGNEEIMSDSDWDEAKKLINDICPTFLRSLCELRFLNETDTNISLLLKLGFTPNNIAKLIGRDKSTITASRKKMAQKAFGKERTAKDWDTFICSL